MNQVVFQPPGSSAERSRGFRAERPRGYSQPLLLTVGRLVTRPRVLCQDQNLEVSGADVSLSLYSLPLSHMIHVQHLNVSGRCFLLAVVQNPPVCWRLVDSTCVCQMEQTDGCLVPVEI